MNRGLIFDMDGVLFLSSKRHHQAFQEVLPEMHVPSYREIAGMRTDLAMEKIYQLNGKKLEADVRDRLVLAKRERAAELLRDNPPIAPGCFDVLQSFSERGWKLGLASSSSQKNVDLFLDESDSRSLFSVVLSGDSVETGKPDPEIYRTARERMGIEREYCKVVEDSKNGILAAARDGLHVIGVVGEHTEEELKSFGVVAVVKSLLELLETAELQV